MAIKKLFLSHYSGDSTEVHELATELRLRGIVPWVDKDGGFLIADHSVQEARRAIRQDCFGLLLYATPGSFTRPFICEVEIDEARSVYTEDASYALFAVPRRLNFDDLRDLSLTHLGIDLSAFHTIPMPTGSSVEEGCAHVASAVLTKVMKRAARAAMSTHNSISLQYSTREILPHDGGDLLCIDAVQLLSACPGNAHSWDRLLVALQDVKKQVSSSFGRPRLYVHGSKHLTAAFLFGRVFAPFELDIRQTAHDVWRTDSVAVAWDPFAVSVKASNRWSGRLFVEIASRYKNVAAAVDHLMAETDIIPSMRLQFFPRVGALDVDNPLCNAMVRQTYREIESVMREEHVTEIHMFVAAPQSFLMMLGREFRGMPQTHLYEWTGSNYLPSFTVPKGLL